MDRYITAAIIKRLREEQGVTQSELAKTLNVSDKTISKWETGRGYPDISLLEPLAKALGHSVVELLAGESVTNSNRSFNMLRMKFYVCPLCGNVITATGETVVSCCGITLPPLEAEEPDSMHQARIEKIEDEYYVTLDHEMTRDHYISFIAGVRDDGCELKKLYPEGPAEARLKINRTRLLYYCCNRHGLYKIRLAGK